MPELDEHTTQDSYISDENMRSDSSTKLVIKKKVRNFSEKYNKGNLIGNGPFGQVYTCWLRED